MIQPLWRTVWRFLKKLGTKLPYEAAIPLLGTYPVKTILKDTCTPIFIAALFTIARIWKKPRCPLTDEWMDKDVVHKHNEILLSHKTEWI